MGKSVSRKRAFMIITVVIIIGLALNAIIFFANHTSQPELSPTATKTPTPTTQSQSPFPTSILPTVSPVPPITPTSTPISYLTVPTFLENVILQERNINPQAKIPLRESIFLQENHIGIDADPFIGYEGILDSLLNYGIKWIRTGFASPTPLAWQWVMREPGVYKIDEYVDNVITDLNNSGVNIVLNLGVSCAGLSERVSWNPQGQGWGALGDTEPEWWFKTQEDRDKFIDFARFMATHFKGRIKYYEIWNEPNCGENPGDIRGGITLEDYRTLLKQVIPIIKQVDPEAKIVAGAVGRFSQRDQNWLLGMLANGIASIVDYVSWHPFYGESPYSDVLYASSEEKFGRTNWEDYISNVQNFTTKATALGFHGGYMAEEMVWRSEIDWTGEQPGYSDIESGKYAARAIVMCLSLNLEMVCNQMREPGNPVNFLPRAYVIRVLSNVMSGAKSINATMNLVSEAENLKNATFVLPNGDLLVSLWNDVIASDNVVSKRTNLTINGFVGQSVTGIDVLNGFQQPLNANLQGENIVINNLLIGDYPIILLVKK